MPNVPSAVNQQTKMKISITGHTSGIGLAIAQKFKEHDHEVRGFSRSNGFDISDKSTRDSILASSKDADVFVNNAYHPTGQTELLREAIAVWKDTKTVIVNLSSKCIFYPTDHVNPAVQEYSVAYKAAKEQQEKIINTLFYSRSKARILNILPGVVNAGPSVLYPELVPGPKIDPKDLAELIYGIIMMRNKISIQTIMLETPDI